MLAQRGAVLTNLQRRQVTAGGVAAVSCHLEMSTGRVEVARRTAGRRHRIGLALTDRVDVQAVEPRCQLTGRARLDGDGGNSPGEGDLRRGDGGPVRQLQIGGQLLAAALALLATMAALFLTGRC